MRKHPYPKERHLLVMREIAGKLRAASPQRLPFWVRVWVRASEAFARDYKIKSS